MARTRWIVLLGAILALRGWLLTTAGYGPDLGQFKLWSLMAEREGLARLYETTDFDYPPLYAYFAAAIGKAHSFIDPDALATQADSTALTVLVKLPALLFDLAIAVLLAALARRARGDGTGAIPAPQAGDVWPAAVYLANPAVLVGSGHWGQPDAVHGFFVLAAFVAITAGAGGWRATAAAWALLALAAVMKPLGAPFFPLLLVVTWLRRGGRGAAVGIAAAAATTLLVFTPFLVESGPRGVLERIVRDVGIMGFTSVNAHNVWWLVGPWKDAESAWIGAVSAKQVGLALSGAWIGALMLLAWRRHRGRAAGLSRGQLLALAGALAFGFFMLSTHMHENHAFATIPLLLAACAAAPPGISARRELGWRVAAVSLGLLINLAAHDWGWRECWPLALGDAVRLGDHPEATLGGGEIVAGWIGTFVNLGTLVAVAAFTLGGGLVRLAWRR